MGKLMGVEEGVFTANSLNDLFSPGRISATYDRIQKLRAIYPNFLNPDPNAGPKVRRRQTLRFAAFLLTDEVAFDGVYPAPKFRQWLKWLTWIGTQSGGRLKLNGVNFNGTASQLILNVLTSALPPPGMDQRPSPVSFSWTHNSNVSQLAVTATTNTATTNPGYSIIIVSPDHSEVTAQNDDEDNI